MFSLFGAPALSQFRLDHLLRALRAEDARVSALDSRWLHFVDDARPLGDSELEMSRQASDLRRRVTSAAERRTASACWSRRASAPSRRGPARPPISRRFAASRPCAAWNAARCTSSNRSAPLGAGGTAAAGGAPARSHDRIGVDRFDRPAGAVSWRRAAAAAHRASWASDGRAALAQANRDWGLALSERRDRLPGVGVRQGCSAIPPMSN